MLEIYQFSDGYCYNTDSLVLAHFAKDFLRKSISILDVGAGSGILGILCAREIKTHLKGEYTLHLVEKDALTSLLAQHNAQHFNGIVHCVDFLRFNPTIKFDFIITNPPFYTKLGFNAQNTRKNMARNQQFLPLKALIKHIKQLLKPNGTLCMCYDARMCGELFFTLGEYGLHIDVIRFMHAMPNREASLVILKAKIQSKSHLRILPPLFTHLSPNQKDNTKDIKDVYKWAHTASIKIDSDKFKQSL